MNARDSQWYGVCFCLCLLSHAVVSHYVVSHCANANFGGALAVKEAAPWRKLSGASRVSGASL